MPETNPTPVETSTPMKPDVVTDGPGDQMMDPPPQGMSPLVIALPILFVLIVAAIAGGLIFMNKQSTQTIPQAMHYQTPNPNVVSPLTPSNQGVSQAPAVTAEPITNKAGLSAAANELDATDMSPLSNGITQNSKDSVGFTQ